MHIYTNTLYLMHINYHLTGKKMCRRSLHSFSSLTSSKGAKELDHAGVTGAAKLCEGVKEKTCYLKAIKIFKIIRIIQVHIRKSTHLQVSAPKVVTLTCKL